MPVALSLLVWGCAPADDAGETADEMDEMAEQGMAMSAEDVSQAMVQLRMDWVEAANADDAAAVAAMYAPDAMFVDQFGQEHRGRDAIRAYLEESFAAGSDLSVTQTWSKVVDHVQVSTGTFSQTATGPDGEMQVEGFYNVTARMMDDGTVQILAHSSAIPQEAPEGM
jgi:uncharacterized protein (TIGR02246 family)